ncbi:hypothetical protein F4775DRAFT_563351 [Biscogniauxia sp. FL1348]|nr:hypothetical protein F4775DRAFT_563351 [Biscogniauxia sp. FL1348]
MAFLEDPRLRQRWNQISHTTETVTENAAAGIWSFGHTYINPCLASATSSLDNCVTVCFGDREERARRARERQRTRGRAEYSFDFYDDWDEELSGQDGGLLGGWRREDWDRVLAGTGAGKGASGEVQDQPRGRNRGMSYGTRGGRRKPSEQEDPTIIPSTAPLGFLARLPFKIGGTLRYKPSAANLQEHPGALRHELEGEHEPLLGASGDDDLHPDEIPAQNRKRSGTTGSGGTSDSFRSRGDLFPSDGEGDEDAIPLDDEFTMDLDHVDDRSSNMTKSSKGKRIAGYKTPRSVSRTTTDSRRPSLRLSYHSPSNPQSPALLSAQAMEDLQMEEARLEREEEAMIEKKRLAAVGLALRRGLSRENLAIESVPEAKSEIVEVDVVRVPEQAILDEVTDDEEVDDDIRPRPAVHTHNEPHPSTASTAKDTPDGQFVPARLPFFR